MLYPPGTAAATFRNVPSRDRPDSIQEAWLAHLQGRDPRRAARAYMERERFRQKRHKPVSQLSDEQREDVLARFG